MYSYINVLKHMEDILHNCRLHESETEKNNEADMLISHITKFDLLVCP